MWPFNRKSKREDDRMWCGAYSNHYHVMLGHKTYTVNDENGVAKLVVDVCDIEAKRRTRKIVEVE